MERVPLSLADEMFLQLDTPSAPFGIQLEVQVNGALDADRLRASLRQATQRHPMLRASLDGHAPSDTCRHWRINDELDLLPLEVRACDDAASLKATRKALHGTRIPLQHAPPFRCVLARDPDGDRILLNVSHAVSDGMGVYRFLTSILRAYAGLADPQPDLPFLEVRDLVRQVGARDLISRLARGRHMLQMLDMARVVPARIAGDGDPDSHDIDFVSVPLNREQSQALQQLRHGHATLNDVVVAALHLTIDRWNRSRNHATGRISMMMPVNTRPPQRRHELVSNLSLWVHVFSNPRDRSDFFPLLDEVTRQTRQLKAQGSAGLVVDLLHPVRGLPLWLKDSLPALLPLTGNRVIGSAVLSNLGKLPPLLPETAEPRVRSLWFSPPCRIPMGLALGVATWGDCVHLSFRYHRQQFSETSAQSFAQAYIDTLLETSSTGMHGCIPTDRMQ